MSTTAQLQAHQVQKTSQKQRVLALIQEAPSMDISELANRLDMQTGTVSARINDLQRDGVITAVERNDASGKSKTTYRHEPNIIIQSTNARKFHEANHPITKFYLKFKKELKDEEVDMLREFYQRIKAKGQ